MKRSIKVLGIMALLAALLCIACPAAFASDTLDIYLNNSLVASYSAGDLGSNFTQEYNTYSSYYCPQGGSYKYYNAAGPSLVDVLTDALTDEGISVTNLDYIDFRDVDGDWSTGDLPISTIYGYYYATPTSTAVAVDPVIALQYAEVGGTLSSTGCLRNFHGQVLGSPGDDTMSEWCQDLDAIYLTSN